MTKLAEPEDLKMLRHRFARTIEIGIAYKTFLNQEVDVGPGKTCIDGGVVVQTTHTLLVAYYSFIYSLFDPSAVNFRKITEQVLPLLPQDAREARDIILKQWQQIEDPLTKIRHNIGFHQSPKEKGSSLGYASYGSMHPLATELIMQGLRVFFRWVDSVYESGEPYAKKPVEADTRELMEHVRRMEQVIESLPHEELFKSLQFLYDK